MNGIETYFWGFFGIKQLSIIPCVLSLRWHITEKIGKKSRSDNAAGTQKKRFTPAVKQFNHSFYLCLLFSFPHTDRVVRWRRLLCSLRWMIFRTSPSESRNIWLTMRKLLIAKLFWHRLRRAKNVKIYHLWFVFWFERKSPKPKDKKNLPEKTGWTFELFANSCKHFSI